MVFIFSRKALRNQWGAMFGKKAPVTDTIEEIVQVAEVQAVSGETLDRRKGDIIAAVGGKDAKSVDRVREAIMPTPLPNPNRGPSSSRANGNNPPPASLGQPSTAMFNGFSNTEFHGGSFVQQNIVSSSKRGLEILEKRVATAAFHNSAQRVDPPRCHPDTRVAILQNIYDWIIKSGQRNEWIMWLNGAAGAGKSAIMQSTADRLALLASIAIASFFFLRGDSTRNTMEPLVATVVYQLIQVIPELSDDILLIIERNPLIFGQSLESQIQQLIIQPLLRLPRDLRRLFVVFIDGLDECNDRKDQANLIKVLGNISSGTNIPVVFIVASRREPQIEAEFIHNPVCEMLHTVPLDNSDVEQTSEDIRCFLVDKFHDIRKTHLFKQHLPINWPATAAVEEIVDKSSGQFIFASVVINYVSSPRTNPATQLEIIRGIRVQGPSSQNPFAQLDALYQHILSQVEALDMVFDIIALNLLAPGCRTSFIESLFLLENGEIDVLFADLTAIILCEPHTMDHPMLKFLHASFPDFLLEKSRSEKYHINLDESRTKLLCMFFKRHPPILDPLWSADDLELMIRQEQRRLVGIQDLLGDAKASEQLHSAIMNFNSTFHNQTFLEGNWYIGSDILQHLKKLDFNDQGEAYHHVLDILAAEYAKYWPSFEDFLKDDLKQSTPDLVIRIDQIWMRAI